MNSLSKNSWFSGTIWFKLVEYFIVVNLKFTFLSKNWLETEENTLIWEKLTFDCMVIQCVTVISSLENSQINNSEEMPLSLNFEKRYSKLNLEVFKN